MDRIVYRPTWDGRVPTLGRPQGICQFSGCKRRSVGRFTWQHLGYDLCEVHARGFALTE